MYQDIKMNKMMKIFSKNLIIIIGLSFFAWAGFAKAEVQIDVEYPVGSNLNKGKIFSEDNILPGWEESKTIRVENDSETDDENLYFTLDVNGDDLAKALKLYVIRVENGSYRIGGEGDHYTLKKADDEKLYMDKLSATKGKQYRVKIKFDKEAGNEYQGKETKFDVEFRIESEEADARTEEEILASQGRVVSGLPPVEGEQELSPEIQTEAAVFDSREEGDEEVEIAGVTKQCNNWPWWVWALILLGYLIIFYVSTFSKKNRENKNIPWVLQIIMAIAVVIFWWYFDNCREYFWFLYSSLGGSGLEYVAFLWTRNRSRYKEAENKINQEKQ